MYKLLYSSKLFVYMLIIGFLGLNVLVAQSQQKLTIKHLKNPLIDETGMSDPHVYSYGFDIKMNIASSYYQK